MRARFTATICLLVSAVFAYACGGDDSIGSDDGGADQSASSDTGSGGDGTTTGDTGTGDTGTGDTGTTSDGGGGDTGTTTDGGATDASAMFSCTKPSDCPNAFCCGNITFNGGNPPNCTLVDASSSCKATCISKVNALSCKTTDTMRSCAVTADCADAGGGYTKCCNVPFQDAAATFCWNTFYAQQAGGSCQ